MLIKKNVFDIADIEFAVLETSGKLSIQLKSINQPPNTEGYEFIDSIQRAFG